MRKIRSYFVVIMISVGLSVLGALFFLFNNYINNVAQETMTHWVQAESMNIAEGNLLTSVTKTQRTISSSDFLKGVVLLDFSKPSQLEQIQFGEHIDPSIIDSIDSNKIILFQTGLFKRYVAAKIPDKESMVIVFSIWSEGLTKVFVGSGILFSLLFSLLALIVNAIKNDEFRIRTSQTKEYAEKASRAAHDIRSPLLNLNAVIDQLKASPEIVQKLSMIANSLKDITADLIESRNTVIEKLPSLQKIEPVASDSPKKDIHFLVENKKELHKKDGIVFIENLVEVSAPLRISSTELRRTLSNILDNAIEAISGKGEIHVASAAEEGFYVISVKDNGKGISEEILPLLGRRGFSVGKENGSGIGLYYAKKQLEEIGGSLSIQSTLGQGTVIDLKIPMQKNRILNKASIQLPSDGMIYVLDDDSLILNTWKLHFKNIGISENQIKYFSSPSKLLKEDLDLSKAIVLSDFDLKDEMDGLDVIHRLNAHQVSLLVTGSADDESVIAKAKVLGNVPVLSKDLIPLLRVAMV